MDADGGGLSSNTGSCFEAYDTLIIRGSHQTIEGHVFHFGGVVPREVVWGGVLVTGHAAGLGEDITV